MIIHLFLKFRYRLVIVAVVLLFTGCAATTPVRENPGFAKATLKIDKVVVLPPEVSVTQLVFSGDNERLPDEERNIGQILNSNVPGILEQDGYTVSDFNLEEQQDSGKDINFTLHQIESAFQQASGQLYEKATVTIDQSRNFRVSIGPIVDPIAEATGADALLIVHYSGYKKSAGLMAKEIVSGTLFAVLTGVAPVPSSTGGGMEIALLDAATGDVLWANRGGGAFDPLSLARRLLAELPKKTVTMSPNVNTSKAETP